MTGTSTDPTPSSATCTTLDAIARVSPDRVRSSLPDLREAVRAIGETGTELWRGPFPDVVRALRAVGRVDLCLARLVEGHADAVRILDQAGHRPRPGTYGVWASRSVGTGARAVATGDVHRLEGQLRFASGIDVVDRALLPGWTDERHHLLFDIDATTPRADRGSWATSAMDAARSFTVHVDTTAPAADVVGDEDFYLTRPGFLIGGLGVAAVWAGGAQSVVDLVAAGLRAFTPTAHQLRRLGVMQQAAWQAATLTDRTAALVEADAPVDADAPVGVVLPEDVARTRTAVVAACETVRDEAGRIVGPGGLSTNARLARTLADLEIYVRQHPLDGETERLGRRTLDDLDARR